MNQAPFWRLESPAGTRLNPLHPQVFGRYPPKSELVMLTLSFVAPEPKRHRASVQVSLAFESVAEGNRFEFDSDGVIDWNNGPCLEHKSREHRTELVNCRRVSAVQQHI